MDEIRAIAGVMVVVGLLITVTVLDRRDSKRELRSSYIEIRPSNGTHVESIQNIHDNLGSANDRRWSAEEREHKAYERRYWRCQSIFTAATLFFSLIAAGGAVVGAIIASRAFRETRRQADAANDQVKIAKETAERQLRAYVATYFERVVCPDCGSANSPGPTATAAPKNYVRVRLENHGQTPAYRPRICVAGWVLKPPNPERLLPQNFDYSCSHAAEGQTIFPGLPSLIYSGLSGLDHLVKMAEQNEGTLFFYGQVDYDDVFESRRTTPICMVFLDREHFGTCGTREGQSED
jgi:hypothetical protein